MAEKQELCKCLDIVKNHLHDLAKRGHIHWERFVEAAGLLDDVSAVERCISIEELAKRRGELRELERGTKS